MFEGKTAVVTGAGKGLGQAMAVALARAGAKLIGVDIGDMTETSRIIEENGGTFTAVNADLSKTGQIPELAKKLEGIYGKVDILVNNAGVIYRSPAEEYPEVVRRIDREGHLIGNHTYNHVQIKGLPAGEAKEEIEKTDRAVYELTGKHTAYIRPPFGAWEEDLELDYEVLPAMWTIDPLDWTTENIDEIVDRVVTQAGENDIILLHDCYESSVEAALRIIDILQGEGFEFVRVDELIIE